MVKTVILGVISTAIIFIATPVRDKTQQRKPDTGCKSCRHNPNINGKRFIVHGTIKMYDGAPTVRIRRSDNNRMLGISEGRFAVDGICNLPRWLEKKLDWDREISGDFVVYPFTDDKPGVMRMVCVDTASHLSIRRLQ